MQLVHALSLFYELKRRNSCYAAMGLHGYVATWLHGYEAKQQGNCETNLPIHVYGYTLIYID